MGKMVSYPAMNLFQPMVHGENPKITYSLLAVIDGEITRCGQSNSLGLKI